MEFIVFPLTVAAASFLLISSNPLYAVIALISIFLNFSVLIFSMGLEFLALIFVIIYVGAICVLFLFIIMLLNLRVVEAAQDLKITTLVMAASSFILLIGMLTQETRVIYYDEMHSHMVEKDMQNFTLLYNHYFVYLVLAGFILLLAMIAAILLTKGSVKNQHDNSVVLEKE